MPPDALLTLVVLAATVGLAATAVGTALAAAAGALGPAGLLPAAPTVSGSPRPPIHVDQPAH